MTWTPLLRDPAKTLLALDFDGTLSPIVQDPARAFIHPRAAAALLRLAKGLGQVAIVTGRPVAQVRELADFAGGQTPQGIVVFGQYGVEWWDSATGETIEPDRPQVIADAIAELPRFLARLDAGEALVEDKRIAVAVHTRGIGERLSEHLLEPMQEFAERFGLLLEPGRQVLELRQPGSDKGNAVQTLARKLGAECVIYAGDDLGDLPAFEALDQCRADGLTTLKIAVSSDEQAVISEFADIAMDSTEAFAEWLEGYAGALGI